MKNTNKKTTTKTVSRKIKTFAAGSREGQIFAQVPYTIHDFKNALLIVSLSVNIFLLTLWLVTEVNSTYAFHVAQFIAN